MIENIGKGWTITLIIWAFLVINPVSNFICGLIFGKTASEAGYIAGLATRKFFGW